MSLVGGTRASTYVSVKDAGDAAAAVRRAGGDVIVQPFDALPAGRMAVLSDPSGAVFCASEPRERQGAQIVNEPSAWAMSTLITRDQDACSAFYTDVFGWKTDRFGEGTAAVALWRLPGYVGGEPRQPVPRDVVAVMASTRNGVPSHWSVDFWVHDADRTAAKAAELRGKILAPPYDSQGFRSAVLQDPQGAVFSISKLMRKER